MATLEFCDKHNMVAYLEKPEGSAEFHQIIDFLTASHIHYALTENPTIYASFIKQFWTTATASTNVNGEVELTASIDGQAKTITEASLRRHLKLEDNGGITSLPNTEIFEQLALMGYATDSDKLTFQKDHTAEEETNHALMAINSSSEVSLCSKTCTDSYNKLKALCDEQTNQLGEQEAKILAYSQAVKKLESQIVTFQKQQFSLNEKLTFQANAIYEKDEKLKKYRRIRMKAIKEKEQL
ncbi:hypothetical protein Tco_0502628 [Tanacetum coccineum]